MRYIDYHPLPTGCDWAAKALDIKAPDPFILGVPGGEPVVAPTIAQTKAQNIASPMPGSNREVPKAIQDRPTQDVRPEVQQTLTKGMKGTYAKDMYMAKKGKGTDFRI